MPNPKMNKKCNEILATLMIQLQHTNYIILADADLTDDTIELIEKISEKNFLKSITNIRI